MKKEAEYLQIGAAYIRVSTDDQTELSPDAQLRVIRDSAKEDGFSYQMSSSSLKNAVSPGAEPITEKNSSV